jgi:beta-glucosidase
VVPRTRAAQGFREPSGQACDSYVRWREDVDLVAGLGLDAYRFSVEWARVEPAEGQFSAEALAHYRAIVDYCLALGIAPVVTYNHFTAPHWFARRGGCS